MRVLFFANTGWYLYNFRLSLADALRQQGHEVLMVSPRDDFCQKLQDLGFRWVEAPLGRRSLNPFSQLYLVLWLRRLALREGTDLIHGFTIKCALYGALAGRLAGVQARVSAITGMGYVFSSDDATARMLRLLVKASMLIALGGRGARVILQNLDDLDLIKKLHVVSSSTLRLVAGSGVNCTRFCPAPNREMNARFRVLLPARLLWDKGVAEFVEASRLLRAKGRDVDFVLAGMPDPGNPASVPEDTVNEWVAQGLVSWLGHVSDMPTLFNSVDIVALPSYREGLPKGLIEAGACAVALITTDVPGCRDVVSASGTDGLLIPCRNATALADAIALLQDDNALRQRLGAAARCRVLAEFDEKLVLGRTLLIYRELFQTSAFELNSRLNPPAVP